MPPLGTPEAGYVATVDEVAVRLGLEGATLPSADRLYVEAKLWDAQADLEGIIGRPPLPTVETVAGVSPRYGHDVMHWQAWAGRWADDIKVTSAVENADGTYDVTVQIGLDARVIPELRRWVVAAAVESIKQDSAATHMYKRLPTSVTADGQSVSYGAGRGEQDRGPFSEKTVQGLQRRYRRPLIGTLTPAAEVPWPYAGSDVLIRGW